MACNCHDATTCHDPASHVRRFRTDAPLRFAEEDRIWCPYCGDHEVGLRGEMCAECIACTDEDQDDTAGDRAMCLEDGR